MIEASSLSVILDAICKAVRLKFDSETRKNETDQRCSAAPVSTERILTTVTTLVRVTESGLVS